MIYKTFLKFFSRSFKQLFSFSCLPTLHRNYLIGINSYQKARENNTNYCKILICIANR